MHKKSNEWPIHMVHNIWGKDILSSRGLWTGLICLRFFGFILWIPIIRSTTGYLCSNKYERSSLTSSKHSERFMIHSYKKTLLFRLTISRFLSNNRIWVDLSTMHIRPCYGNRLLLKDTQQDYYGQLCGTLLHSYYTGTYTEVTVLLLWSSSNATLEYPCSRYSWFVSPNVKWVCLFVCLFVSFHKDTKCSRCFVLGIYLVEINRAFSQFSIQNCLGRIHIFEITWSHFYQVKKKKKNWSNHAWLAVYFPKSSWWVYHTHRDNDTKSGI